jgi:hypothetical protein
MKVMYSILKGNEEIIKKEAYSIDNKQTIFSEKLVGVFKPDSLGRLVKRRRGVSNAEIKITLEGEKIGERNYEMSFSTKSKNNVVLGESAEIQGLSSLYIPATEMLTIYPGFLSNYINRRTPYDETFYYMALALGELPSRGPQLKEAKQLLKPIEEATNIKVSNSNDKFYITFDKRGKMEASLVAEGMKKIGMLIYLISNGSLGKNSILFWDEPEAHLNPKYISIVVDFLKVIASRGVQVFVSTHDYLLSQRLSLIAENDSPNKPDMQFIGLYNDEEDETTVFEVADTLAGIEHNSILDEFALYADDEEEIMYK